MEGWEEETCYGQGRVLMMVIIILLLMDLLFIINFVVNVLRVEVWCLKI